MVNISATTYDQVKNKYACDYRGKLYAKNVGDVDMYFISHEIVEYENPKDAEVMVVTDNPKEVKIH